MLLRNCFQSQVFSVASEGSKLGIEFVGRKVLAVGSNDECETDLLCGEGSGSGPLTQLWIGAYQDEIDLLTTDLFAL